MLVSAVAVTSSGLHGETLPFGQFADLPLANAYNDRSWASVE
jgi:hypothetical protein